MDDLSEIRAELRELKNLMLIVIALLDKDGQHSLEKAQRDARLATEAVDHADKMLREWRLKANPRAREQGEG